MQSTTFTSGYPSKVFESPSKRPNQLPTKNLAPTFVRFLANTSIPQAETVKILGLLFHTCHSWIPPIKATIVKCLRAFNILKFLSHPKYVTERF